MKITGLSVRLLRIDPTPRYRDGVIPPGRPTAWHFPLLALHTDEGLDGHAMVYGPHGDGAAAASILRHVYLPELLGENPAESEKLWQKLHCKQRHLYNQTDTLRGALDVAIWDLRGKAAGRSIAHLLGFYRKRLPCYASARSEDYTADEFRREAMELKAAGFHGYKLQVRGGPAADIPRLAAVRDAVGSDFALMQDPNGAYSFDEALEVGFALDELHYTWFEEPIRDQQLHLLARLQAYLKTPLLVGETLRFAEFHLALQGGAVRMLRGDTMMSAGITGLRKLMAAAEVCGMNLEIHTACTPLIDVANLHVAGASANCRFIENHHPIFRFGLRDDPLEIDQSGHVTVPTGPGLGVELDWDWIENHTDAQPLG
jgi:L-alanine-DL-glutamate epimerase-like enolase superfamily enzyme